MILLRTVVVLLPLVAVTVAPAPAGIESRGCGALAASSDPELRMSFERFDRVQSPSARRACRLFLSSAAA